VTRFLSTPAVLLVAVIAAVISYTHIETLALVHGQTETAARLLPLSVDGLILAASLVLLQAARNGQQAPALPRFALWLGIGATVAANLAYGVPYGPVGAVVSAWPGLAFVLTVEILLGSLRRSQEAPASGDETVPRAVPEAAQAVPTGAPAAARRPSRALPVKASPRRGDIPAPAEVFAAELEAGQLPTVREIKRRARCGQDTASRIKSELAALIQTPATVDA
jgi:Protein of unknown function (DUF2637)